MKAPSAKGTRCAKASTSLEICGDIRDSWSFQRSFHIDAGWYAQAYRRRASERFMRWVWDTGKLLKQLALKSVSSLKGAEPSMRREEMTCRVSTVTRI